MIEDICKKGGLLNTLFSSIEQSEKVSVFGCGLGEKLNIALGCNAFILYVAGSDRQSEVTEKLNGANLRCDVLSYTPSLCNTFNNQQLIDTLYKLINSELDALVIDPIILNAYLPNKDYLKNNMYSIAVGDNVSIDKIVSKLTLFGFERVEFVENDCSYSVKGDTIDIKIDGKYYRIMWDWDKIEKIKQCDSVSLIPTNSVDCVKIKNNTLFEIDDEKLNEFYVKTKNAKAKQYIDENRSNCQNIWWFLPFSKCFLSKIYDYVPNCVVFFDDIKSNYDTLKTSCEIYNQEIKDAIKNGAMSEIHKSYLFEEQLVFPENTPVVGFQSITNANRIFSPNRVFNFRCMPSISYRGKWDVLALDLGTKMSNSTQILYIKSNENANQISQVLDKKHITHNIIQSISKCQNGVNLLPRAGGISCAFVDENIFVYSSDDLCGVARKVENKNFVSFDMALPEKNDIVVHNIYGVGRCLGVECLNLSNSSRDYVIIEYKNNDKLYLPVENINQISKYIGGDNHPALNKLGSNDFAKTKEKVKAKIKEMAFSLVELYKARLDTKGFVYPKETELMSAFAESFGYTETADQVKALQDIFSDMESGRVMDRLVCGDVGFGKTEVAMRAAFKTVVAGKQVAFMCPTTILSEQHYNTLVSRMKGFGIKIEVLNRFRTNAECEKIYQKVKDGEVDIVVGTHKLLNKNIVYKNLGLLILDEEQKFGVEAKETIKEVRKNVNVLTLSATPIPRTLNMALSGIRDISVIETPPVSRIPTQVQVCEYSDLILKNAILRELERGGQVLVVYNKVETIYEWVGRIQSLVGSDVSIDVAHGQMEEKKLESAIMKLYNGETQILVSTTLIENGVDLPNANTLVVLDSDELGLSQLYQLKGRIGRSDRQAYAYFTYRKDILNETAYKRLEAISQFTAMGSGFKIALRDLEIRGAGNVLGVEQHGHMQKVGYAMYIQLLNEAVGELKGNIITHTHEVRVETSLNAFVPHDYIQNYGARMSAYMKISKLTDIDGYVKLYHEFEDAFGDVPNELNTLLKISLVKNLAQKMGATKVVVKAHECKVFFEKIIDVERYMEYVNSTDDVVLEVESVPIIIVKGSADQNILDKSQNFLSLCTT